MVDQEQLTKEKDQKAENVRARESIDEGKAKLEKPELEVDAEKPGIPSSDSKESKASKNAAKAVNEEKPEVIEAKTEAVKSDKQEAVVNGMSLPISTKHSIAVCNFIRGKHIDRAIVELESHLAMKKAIPMRGEIPHKKGMMSGRCPVKAMEKIIKESKSKRNS